jgi:Protein of unknown function (DUF5674)
MLRAKDVTNYRRSKFENSIFSGFSSVDLTLQRLLMLFSKLFKKPLSLILKQPADAEDSSVCGPEADELMEIILVDQAFSRTELMEMAERQFGDMVKAVIDIDKKLMAIGGGLHVDEESYLLERGSIQENLWGINLHPQRDLPDMVEFDSVINIRPAQDNLSRYVEDRCPS